MNWKVDGLYVVDQDGTVIFRKPLDMKNAVLASMAPEMLELLQLLQIENKKFLGTHDPRVAKLLIKAERAGINETHD